MTNVFVSYDPDLVTLTFGDKPLLVNEYSQAVNIPVSKSYKICFINNTCDDFKHAVEQYNKGTLTLTINGIEFDVLEVNESHAFIEIDDSKNLLAGTSNKKD